MRIKVLFHDGCFDGAASAAIFSRFLAERVDPTAAFVYRGVSHKGQGLLDERLFDGEINALLDFRYSASPKLHWWFDHHVTAFPNEGEEAHFRADPSGQKFHDPGVKSCTGLIARVLSERFGFDVAPMAELVHWAEIIDGALFEDARTPVMLEAPALQMMTVIEANPGPGFIPGLIPELTRRPMVELVAMPEVASRLAPLRARHLETVELVRERARLEDGVVFFDAADRDVGALNKFIVYYLHPAARYSVSVTRGPGRAKISVGSNPWAQEPRTHDLARICERFGGGGHPVVGAVSYPPERLEDARRDAATIVAELRQG